MIIKETKYIIRRILISVGVILLLGFIRSCNVYAEEIKTLYGNTSKIGGITFNNINNPIWINNGQEANKSLNVTIGWYYDTYTEKPFNTNDKINVVLKACMTGQTIAAVTSAYNNQIDMIYNTKTSCAFSNWSGTIYEILMTLKVDNIYYDDIDSDNGTIFAWYVQLNQSSLYFYNNVNYNVAIIWKQIDYMKKSNYDSYLAQLRNSGVQNEILEIQNNINNSINNQTNSINNTIDNQTNSITNSQNNTTNAVNGMNDTLKDSSIDSPNSSISQMEQNLPTNSVISDLLTLPIRMFQNILNAVNGSCSPFSLGTLFGTSLILPCINLQNYLGSALWSAIDVIFCGIFVLSMRKKFVEIFENITSLKNGGNELE